MNNVINPTYQLPALDRQIEQTVSRLDLPGTQSARVAVAPYRICPIGAHVDHQGGPVLGVGINAYTVLAFVPSSDGRVSLTSSDFEGRIEFSVNGEMGKERDWARYARGAVVALHQIFPNQVRLGFTGHISGRLLGAGLSSSASAGVAYLMALAEVNGLSPTQAQLVELDRLIENEYLGLNNGVQDQTTIIYSRQDGIVHQNTLERVVTHVKHHQSVGDVAWLVIFSGYTRELTSSGFNDRVAECWQAAAALTPNGQILSDVSEAEYEANRDRLPADLQRRAAHFFTERKRVEQGKALWSVGDYQGFGDLMNLSCQSSINQYECGSDPLIKLHEIASQTAGVLGSRFSGGGYGGCLVALANRDEAEQAIRSILTAYRQAVPQKADVCAGWMAEGVNGAAIV